MRNRWASPEGFAELPRPVRYRIRAASGEIVERTTSCARDFAVRGGRYYMALDHRDQKFANEIASLIQSACTYFYADDWKPMTGVPDVRVSDAQVRERIERLDRGENTREAERERKQRYPLAQLPWDQQRALVERIEQTKQDYAFEILGEVEEHGGRASAAEVGGSADYGELHYYPEYP